MSNVTTLLSDPALLETHEPARRSHRARGDFDFAGGSAGRSDRQSKALPARSHRLRVRGARSALEPAGDRSGASRGGAATARQ